MDTYLFEYWYYVGIVKFSTCCQLVSQTLAHSVCGNKLKHMYSQLYVTTSASASAPSSSSLLSASNTCPYKQSDNHTNTMYSYACCTNIHRWHCFECKKRIWREMMVKKSEEWHYLQKADSLQMPFDAPCNMKTSCLRC